MAKLRPVGDWIAGRFEVFAVHPGGMGVVYVAHDHFGPPGRSVVAIKTLRDEWLRVEEWKARFAAEGELWVEPRLAPEHRPRPLGRGVRRQAAHPPGADHRRRPPQADRLGRAGRAPGDPAWRPVLPGDGARDPPGTPLSSRRQARQPHDRRGRHAQDHRLRPRRDPRRTPGRTRRRGSGARFGIHPPRRFPRAQRPRFVRHGMPAGPRPAGRADPQADADRLAPGDTPLHGPRAVPRLEGRQRPRRHLCVRGGPVRDADRRAALPWPDDRPA